ncbi:hypothetical protein MKX03_034421, partial [Papaver bracteatum]
LSPKFMEEYTDVENKLLQQQKPKTKADLLEEESNVMTGQIESLQDTYVGDMENLRVRHTQEIKELTRKHSEEMGNLLLKHQELEHSLAEATTSKTLFDRKMESLVEHLSSKQPEVDELLAKGGNVAKFMAEKSCEYMRTVFPDEYRSSLLNDEINNIMDQQGDEGMESGVQSVDKNVFIDEGIQDVPDAAIDEGTQAVSEASRRPAHIFPVLTVDNPSSGVDTSNNQEKILDMIAEGDLPSFPKDSAEVPLSMDQCLNL